MDTMPKENPTSATPSGARGGEQFIVLTTGLLSVNTVQVCFSFHGKCRLNGGGTTARRTQGAWGGDAPGRAGTGTPRAGGRGEATHRPGPEDRSTPHAGSVGRRRTGKDQDRHAARRGAWGGDAPTRPQDHTQGPKTKRNKMYYKVSIHSRDHTLTTHWVAKL